MHGEQHSAPPRGLVIAAFAAVYTIWGGTYLAIRYAVETIPPFLMGGSRFIVAGLMLYGVVRITGSPAPGRVHWKNALIAGALMLGIGNGGLNWAAQRVPSSVSALLIAVTPLWFAVLEWLRPKGTRPSIQTVAGILVGFAGMALLVNSRDHARQVAVDPAGVVALMIASLSWAGGSLLVRYTPKPESALMGVALQMITGGGVLTAMGLVAGEGIGFELSEISTRSAVSFFLLIFVGSMLGFTSYSWLLKVSTPARISTYAYVNPVVAVFLGWGIGGEVLTQHMLMAAGIVLIGVIIITTPGVFAKKPASNALTERDAAVREV